MSAVRQVAGNASGQAIVASSTQYASAWTGHLKAMAAEADSLIAYRTAGTITNLTCRIISGNRTADHVVVLRNSATDGGGCDIAYTSTPGEFEDATGTNAIAVGDTVSYRYKSGGTGNANYTFTYIGCLWAATGTTTCHLGAYGADSMVSGITSYFFAPGGNVTNNVTQANGEWKVLLPSGVSSVTFKNLYVRLTTNTNDATAPMSVSGLTGAGTAPSVTLAAGGGAAVLEDTTNSKAAASGDLMSFKTVAGGTTFSVVAPTVSIEVESTDGVFFIVNSAATGLPLNTDSKFVFGSGAAINTTESRTQSKFGLTGATISNLAVFVSSAGAGSTLRLRAGAADAGTPSPLGITTAAGWQTDTANTYAPASTDELNYNWVKSANATITCIAITIATPTVSGGTVNVSTAAVQRAANW